MNMLMGHNLLVAQSGGPTAVINASVQGVVEEAKKHSGIKGIYGARFGIEGVLKEDFIDLGKESEVKLRGLSSTPASALGSCRRKLTENDFSVILEVLKKYDIGYFFYIGGNDSMDTCNKISTAAAESGYELKVMGIPKTIDNDLAQTDHCPGYGSAARYAAISALELWKDVESLPIHVCIMELMGRNAGWLTAASVLAKKSENDGPHLVYLPERPFIEEEFLEDVQAWHSKVGGVLVAVSEGLVGPDGNPLADSGIVDGFGHRVAGGVAQYLSNLVMSRLGIKSRSEKPGLLGRASIAHQSAVDREEALEIGKFAVSSAVDGKSGYMASISRISDEPYASVFKLVPLNTVANIESRFPEKWINKRGNGVEEAFNEYCMPLIGATLPEYVSLDKNAVERK